MKSQYKIGNTVELDDNSLAKIWDIRECDDTSNAIYIEYLDDGFRDVTRECNIIRKVSD